MEAQVIIHVFLFYIAEPHCQHTEAHGPFVSDFPTQASHAFHSNVAINFQKSMHYIIPAGCLVILQLDRRFD